jgi:hypothetical protein
MRSIINFIITTIFVLSMVPSFAQDMPKAKIDSAFIDSATAEPGDLTKIPIDTLQTTANSDSPLTERKNFHTTTWVVIIILLIVSLIGFRYKYKK